MTAKGIFQDMMKSKSIYTILSLILAFLFTSSTPAEVNVQKDEILMKLVYNSLKANHYAPKSMDNSYSSDVFDLYIQRLDYTKRFFLQEDIDLLEKYRDKIDDEVRGSTYEFFDLSIELLEKRIAEAQDYYSKALNKSFDFEKEEFIELDGEKREFLKTKKELKERWYQTMKYETLIRLNNAYDKNEKVEEEGEKKSFKEMEEKAREKVLKNTNNWFDRLNKQERDDWVSIYINCLANVYDPHTGYYPPKDKEDFDIQMSGRFEGIGARLSEKDGYIEIVDIIPGSASWKLGELEVGDLILEVSNENETVDVVGMRVDHAVKYIRGPKGTPVTLTVKKKDGEIANITITRDVVELEQTYARSTVLKKDSTEEGVGYIYLPKFYANFNSKDGRTCSADVAAEVEKLKAENVSGMIIDLRNNGGGSLQDVVKIAGLFIESGPIVQVKDRYRPAYILKDTDPEVLYDGPLVIMTNFFSASASEILAAAMQDYNRAIVMGSTSTFGKGTVQSFVNLDQYVDRLLKGKDSDELPSLGSIKMTFQKFYRIDGRSTQLKGVTPDIILPDDYQEIELGEKEQDFALEWDEIEEAKYTSQYPEGFQDKLSIARERSYQRIDTSSAFNQTELYAEKLKSQQEQTFVPVNFQAYRDFQANRKEENKEFKVKAKKIKDLNVFPVKDDALMMESDSVFSAKREKWFKKIQKDRYIDEAVHVIRDINSL